MTVSEVTMEGMEDRGRKLCSGVGMGARDSVAGDVRERIETGVKRNGLWQK